MYVSIYIFDNTVYLIYMFCLEMMGMGGSGKTEQERSKAPPKKFHYRKHGGKKMVGHWRQGNTGYYLN